MTAKTGIIYLQRDKFQVYSPYLPAILEFRFVPELIRDFDIVNRQLFDNLLKVFLANNKIPPSNLIIVIADSASFIKDFVSTSQPVNVSPQQPQTPPPTLEDLQNAAKEYLEHIPFESVAAKVFPLATGVRAYATNQEVYDTLKVMLEKQGFIITSVLPGFVFGPNLSNRPALDGPSVGEMLQKLSTLQGYNLLKEPFVASPAESDSTLSEIDEPEGKGTIITEKKSSMNDQDNKKVFLAVAISAIVIIVVVTVTIVFMQFQEKPYVPPPTPSQAQQTSVPTSTQTSQTSQTEESIAVGELTVQISNPSSFASTSAELRTALATFGFKSVVPVTQNSVGVSQNLLIFSSRVGSQIRSSVTDTVKEIVPDIVVQERSDSAFDITVILGN